MKINKLSLIFFAICILLVTGFLVTIFADLAQYNETYSAPFSVFLLIRGIEFLLPAAILFSIALVLRKKPQKHKED